jgi:hypothetical protein
VKVIFFFITGFFYVSVCLAQDTVEQKNRLSDSVVERFYVLKSYPQIKQGSYKAYFRPFFLSSRVMIASGNYSRDKKIGIWSFYGPNGKLVEKYNYNTNSFLFEAPLDSSTDIFYFFDKKFVPTDTVTRPLKIGGYYYGFIPYLTVFQLPFETNDINTYYFNAYVELLVSPLGRLAEYKVHVASDYYKYNNVTSMDINLFSEADRTFTPATLNGEPIASRIMIKCYVTSSGGLNFY